MATATIEDRVVTRLAAITAILTDPAYLGRSRTDPGAHLVQLKRAGQLAERADPVVAPLAGTWMHEGGARSPWHLSSGIAEQPFIGACNGWFLVVPACNRRYMFVVDVQTDHRIGSYRMRTLEVGTPVAQRCDRCIAIEAKTVKPANWQAAAS